MSEGPLGFNSEPQVELWLHECQSVYQMNLFRGKMCVCGGKNRFFLSLTNQRSHSPVLPCLAPVLGVCGFPVCPEGAALWGPEAPEEMQSHNNVSGLWRQL